MLKKLPRLQWLPILPHRPIALQIVCCGLALLIFWQAQGQSVELPRCVNSPQTLKNIAQILGVNSQNFRKYNGYRVELQKETELDLISRLVYAEVLAAECPEFQIPLIEAISSVVLNRIFIRGGPATDVIFERNQFASSLHMSPRARSRDFLCPQDQKLWDRVHQKVALFLKTKKTAAPRDTVHYFLYRHDPRWTKEPWTLKEFPFSQPEGFKNCLRMFHNPLWK